MVDYYQLENLYNSVGAVLVALFVLFFIILYNILLRTGILGGSRGTSIIISFVISLMAVYYIYNAYYWLVTFNFLIGLFTLIVILFIISPFFRRRPKP